MNHRIHKRFLAFLLSAALAVPLAAPAYAKTQSGGLLKPRTPSSSAGTGNKKTTSGGQILVSALRQVARDYNVPAEFLQEISNRDRISLGEMQRYAAEYRLPAQYVQRFFDNYFVFQAGNSLRYVPVESGYPKHKYNFDNLVRKANGEVQYVVDGKSRALKGIDVSEFQGAIDWAKVKADGVRFAFIRVGYRGYSQGQIHEDQYFQRNMAEANRVGIPVGVYFFSQAVSQAEAREEAQFTLERIQGYDVQYPVVIDMEDAGSSSARTYNMSARTTTDVAAAFCQTVKQAGYRPMIYSGSQWFVSRMDMSRLPYDKWLAQYYQYPFFPYQFNIWQYTGKGRVNGIRGDVDMNLCFVKYQ